MKIIENVFSYYHIVTSFFADECERYAVSQLQKYIYESTNTLVLYFSDICESRGKEFLIGKEALNAKEYIDDEVFASLDEEGFVIKTSSDGNIVICGKTPRGTLYGVYEFLERYLGYRAFTNDVEKLIT